MCDGGNHPYGDRDAMPSAGSPSCDGPRPSRPSALWWRLSIAAAAIPLLRFATDWSHGFDYLMHWFLVDDAFYYFEISRHIPEFNRGIPTTGFHPLYAFAVAPLHRFLSYELAVPLSLLLLVTAQAAGTLLLFRLVSRFWSGSTACACACVWAASGQMYGIAMMGVETVIAAVVVLAFFDAWTALLSGSLEAERAWLPLWAGVLAGLAFLARMDSALVLGPALFWLLLALLRAGRLRAAAVFALAAAALPLCWLGSMQLATGEFLPTSGAALRLASGRAGAGAWPPDGVAPWLARYGNQLLSFLLGEVRSPPAAWLAVAGVALPALAAGALRRREPHLENRLFVSFAVACLAGLGVWAAYYIFFQGIVRPWYAAHLGIAVYGIYLPLVFFLAERILRRPLLVACVSVTLVVALANAQRRKTPIAPQEVDKYRAALAANAFVESLPGDQNIGSFNAGIYHYFMDRDVINLDGVVNPEALAAHRGGTLPDYIREKRVTVLIDHDLGRASSLGRIRADPRLRLRRWIDLSKSYPPFAGRHAKRTYLWKLEVDRP